MEGAVYRVCSKCGKTWNVSAVFPGEKRYVCPTCETKELLKSRAKKVREQHGK